MSKLFLGHSTVIVCMSKILLIHSMPVKLPADINRCKVNYYACTQYRSNLSYEEEDTCTSYEEEDTTITHTRNTGRTSTRYPFHRTGRTAPPSPARHIQESAPNFFLQQINLFILVSACFFIDLFLFFKYLILVFDSPKCSL
jgi:hypothetical protein